MESNSVENLKIDSEKIKFSAAEDAIKKLRAENMALQSKIQKFGMISAFLAATVVALCFYTLNTHWIHKFEIEQIKINGKRDEVTINYLKDELKMASKHIQFWQGKYEDAIDDTRACHREQMVVQREHLEDQKEQMAFQREQQADLRKQMEAQKQNNNDVVIGPGIEFILSTANKIGSLFLPKFLLN